MIPDTRHPSPQTENPYKNLSAFYLWSVEIYGYPDNLQDKKSYDIKNITGKIKLIIELKTNKLF